MTFASYLHSQFTTPQYLEFALRMIVAALCGAAFGIERSKRFKEAGIRTHMIVCIAASLIMIVSKYGFQDVIGPGDAVMNSIKGTDPARLAAQFVSGIGFLGAGMIFKNGSSIKGLTTAAGILATSGVGLCIGAGMYALGVFCTLLIVFIQFLFHRLKIGADSYTSMYLEIVAIDSPDFYQSFKNMVEGMEGQLVDLQIRRDSGKIFYETHLKVKNKLSDAELYDFFEDYPEIISISGRGDLGQ